MSWPTTTCADIPRLGFRHVEARCRNAKAGPTSYAAHALSLAGTEIPLNSDLLDVADVNKTFTVQQWTKAANEITEVRILLAALIGEFRFIASISRFLRPVQDILARGKVPIVAGGSGLY